MDFKYDRILWDEPASQKRAQRELTALRDRIGTIAARAVLVIGVPVVASFAISDFQPALAAGGALLFSLLGVGLRLIRKGRGLEGRVLILCTIAITLLGRAAVFGGVNSVPFTGWVIVVMLSAVLIGARAAWTAAIVGIACGGLLFTFEARGFLPEALRANTPLTALRISAALFLIVALLTATLSRRIEQSLERVASADKERIDLLNRYRQAARGGQFGIWELDLTTDQVWLGPGLLEMLGQPTEPVTLTLEAFTELLHPEDRDEAAEQRAEHLSGRATEAVSDLRVLHEDNRWIWVQSRGRLVPSRGESGPRMVGSLIDIEKTKTLERELTRQAFHDPLTNLPNRQSFLDELKVALEQAARQGVAEFAVLFIDLDRFKTVNDSLGHSAGDQLLIALAGRITVAVQATGTVARLGGDEFTVLLRGVRELEEAKRVADRLAASLAHPFSLQGREIFLRASIGVLMGSLDHSNPPDLLRDADLAMYSVKGQPSVAVGVFEPSMREDVQALMDLDGALREGVDQRAFVPWYQPIVDLETGNLAGVEALARWIQKDGSVVGPGAFIGRAEETGWVLELDRQVIERAVEDMTTLDTLVLSVNLSARQLHETGSADWLFAVLKRFKFPAHRLQVEVTETMLLTDLRQAKQTLARLRDAGIRVALDDFGTGYSSLTYVHALDPQILKIDISFVQEMGDAGPGPICEAIVSVADKLGLGTSAEGIETQAQSRALVVLGCRYGQGYLFGRPVPFAELSRVDWDITEGY